MQVIKILHITNHPGTIQNINQVATYINTSYYTTTSQGIQLEITTHPWYYDYYVTNQPTNRILG
jgi:hypothetical protein